MEGDRKVVIVGGGAAGMSAASRIKKLKPEWKVSVFEATGWVSHAPCGIPYVIGGLAKGDSLMHYRPEFFIRERGIDLHLGAKVVEVEEGEVRVREGNGERGYEWDYLVLANGASPKVPPIPGRDLEGVFTVDLPQDAVRIGRYMKKNRVRHAVVIGAGYVGIEMAEAFVMRGINVTVIEALDRVMARVHDREITGVIERKLTEHLTLVTGELTTGIEGDGRVMRVVTDSTEYPADIVVLATGIKPNTKLAQQLGARIGETGAVWTDSRMRTSVENVYAAGDVAETVNLITGKRTWMPLAPVGNKMGYVAGVNVAGGNLEFPGVLGTAVMKFMDMEIGRTGLTEEEARKEGYDVRTAFIKAKTAPHYYPDAGDIYLKGVAESSTGRLLGVQVAGKGVLARLDTAAAMIHAGFTTKKVFFTDLAYAPPFAPVWDPLIVLARVLKL